MNVVITIGRLLIISYFAFMPLFAYTQELFSFPKKSPQEILEFIQQKNLVDDSYYLQDITYDYVKQEWGLFYISKEPYLGGHFLMIINDNDLNDRKVIGGA